jgi:diaminopimelate epimerase
MKLAFVKMHGIGNDFVLIDNMSRRLDLASDQIRLLADRRRGIGCDQLLIIEPPDERGADVRARIFNQDGSESGQCGNGLRCLAVWLRDIGVANGECITIEAGNGLVRARLANHRQVKMDMGVPRFEPGEIPFLADKRAPGYRVQVGSDRLEIGAVSMGNPHAVIRVEDCDSAAVEVLGPAVQSLEAFPEGVNVGFMQILDDTSVRLRVYERGVGETLACGSGACAAVAVGRVRGWLGPRVAVALPGGELVVEWDGEGESMWLTGPTQRAFEGEFEL